MTGPSRRPALPEQSVQVLQADERQRWGGLPLDQQLPDHQQGVPEEALQPASLLFSQCGRQEDGDVHHEKDGGTGGRVEARVCVVESCWSPLDSVISVAGVCQSLTAPRQHHLTAPDSNSPTSDSSSSLTALTAPTASDSNTRQLRQHPTATDPLDCQTRTRQHLTALTAPDSWSDRGT